MTPRRTSIGPDFIVIGAQKGGTTSLYRYLVEHPAIVPAATKQLDFFHVGFGRGLDWYLAQFPTALERGLLTGEASPYYMPHPHAPARIRAFDSEIKLIAILRNPVDRTYSHYQHQVRNGREALPFEQALEAEEERLAPELERMLEDDTYYSRVHRRCSYLARSRYAEQLEVWLSLFERDQILVLRSEALFEDPQAELDRTASFLGVAPWSLSAYPRYMPGSYWRQMANATRDRLVRYFRPHNERLYRLLGVSYPWDT